LPDPAVLAVYQRRLRPRVVALRPDPAGAAVLDPAADHRVPDPLGLPRDLLLLPQGDLPLVAAVPAGLRGARAAPGLPRREAVPADLDELAPVFLLPGEPPAADQHL